MHYQQCQIPLVIGVVGHRDIDPHDPILQSNIESVLQDLKKDYPDTPFTLISPLAEGADRLLAKLAQKCLAARLIVPLPLPLEYYRRDFGTVESLAEFEKLLQSADDYFELPLQEPLDAVKTDGEARNRQYAQVGAFVAEHSQILLTIWDGQPSRGTGGTAEVIRWALERRIPAQFPTLPDDDLFDSVPVNLVVQINPQLYTVAVLGGENREHEARAAFSRLNEFNNKAVRLISEHSSKIQASLESLLNTESDHPLLQTAETLWLLSIYAVADAMSIENQVWNKRVWYVIYGLFTIAMAGFGLIDLWPKLVVWYFVAFWLMFGCYEYLKRKGYEDRFLDYRALAEGLRVMLFWRLNNLPQRVSSNYLRKHRGILSWIRYSLSNIENAAFLQKDCNNPDSLMALNLTQKLWIDAQHAYFEHKLKTLYPQIKCLDSIALVSYVLILVIAGSYCFYVIHESDFLKLVPHFLQAAIDSWGVNWDAVFQAMIGFFGAVSLVAGTYTSRESLEEIQKQCTLLASLYRHAGEQLREDTRSPQTILFDLGREALQENGDWLWWRRNQPKGPPKG